MSEYVGQIGLEINGQEITDFKTVTEGARIFRKEVNLMGKIGTMKLHGKRHPLSVDYVVPADAPEFDFIQVVDGTLTIDHLNGTRICFGGVTILDIGEQKYDGENELVRPINLIATSRNEV